MRTSINNTDAFLHTGARHAKPDHRALYIVCGYKHISYECLLAHRVNLLTRYKNT